MSLIHWLMRRIGAEPQVRTVRRPSSMAARARYAHPGGKLRCTRSLWEERGWKVRGDELRGFYRTRLGSFEGRIEKPFSPKPLFYIKAPPQAALEGPHGPCFRQKSKREFWIHLSSRTDLNTGILRIEHCLYESLSA